MKKISLSNSGRQIAKSALFVSVLGCATVTPAAEVLFDQMTNPSNTILISSWFAPDGSDSDIYRYDNFLLPNSSAVEEVWWVGGGGVPTKFTVRFYTGLASLPDHMPTITSLPESEHSQDYLKGYSFNGNANETPIPGTALNQYHVTLPTALNLPGNTVFWIKIEADVAGFPNWGVAMSTHGRDARHVVFYTGYAMFLAGSGSEAFQLRGTTSASQTIAGNVTLSDFTSVVDQVVSIEVFAPGDMVTPLQVLSAPLTSTGAFSVVTSPALAVGSYDIRVKGEHWLAKRVTGVSMTNTGASGVDATLINGDVNGDNVIDLTDYTEIVTDFNALIGDPNYHTWVDLNGDGAIDLTDYTVLVTNFNALGDN
ncbi:MAG: hypothetical protein K8R88_06045 [Armatimonadetes bacterium]|nr:hypothetical protein [Armatimonadota bacterium]